MKSTFVLAQLAAEPTPAQTLEKSRWAVAKAKKEHHADFIIFPESFMFRKPRGTDRNIILDTAQRVDGPFVNGMRELACEYGVWMAFGMNELSEDPHDPRSRNSMLLLSADGDILRNYHKTHLYDASAEKESDLFQPGGRLFEPLDTPFGRLGMLVCYELRFPEIARYQALKGAEILIVPAAWYRGDLKVLHWTTLLTARAIENTAYVLGCSQYSAEFVGESAAVDPAGIIVAHGTEGECLVPCLVDTDRVKSRREAYSSCMTDRRPELYRVEG